ncbi:hypothetical protein BBP40_002894 [Aspergillus hancockii]|nr:hypothetical protein BBP40_002894 [Aspergillus hancockii]
MSPSLIEQREGVSNSPKGVFENIPIIDVSALTSPHGEEREKLAAHIYEACTQVGFFYIKKYRGFMPLYAEQLTGTGLNDPVEQSTTGALSEAFDIGYEISADPERATDDILPPDIYSLYGDNQWPSNDVVPGFRQLYLTYFGEALMLSRKLMRSFALALHLEEDFFDSMMNYPGATSRMLHYPPQPVEGEVIEGLGPHTDKVPALQVRNARDEWILAPPIPGTLVVNIADCLSIWTNRKFKSTVHRVTNLTGQERYSIPFFFGVDYDTTVSVLPNCISEDEPACKEPFKAGEFVRAELAKVYVGYSGEPALKGN